MDENFNCGLHLPLQVSGDSNSVWHRENGHPARLSPDLSHNHMGCDVASLDLLHSNHIQNVTGRNENYVSFGKSGTISDEHNDDRTGRRPPPSNCKSDVEIFTREGDDSEVYVRYFSPLRECTKSEDDGSQQHFSKRGESESDESTAMDLKYCPNSRTIKELQASFGQLFRIGTIRGVTWTKEIPNEACRLVLPHPIPVRRTSEDQESVCMVSNYGNNDVSQKGRNHSLLVVDTFAGEQDRRRVAAIFGHDLPHNCRHPKKLVYYMKSVAVFGFNHIIIIGETDYGMIFMDCYGRFFQWDDMCQPMLWPNESDDGLPWFVEYDGIVYKFKE